MAGENTGKFGRWLTEYLKDTPYRVYYDHGNRETAQNVCEIQGYWGDTVTIENRLVKADLMIAGPDDDIIALIEIEESSNSPKVIIGDVFANLMCNRFAVKQNDFHITPQTELVVAGVAAKGSKFIFIQQRLKQFAIPDDSIKREKIKFIFEKSISATLEALKNWVKDHPIVGVGA